MADFGETVELHCFGMLDDGTVIIDTKAVQHSLTVKVGSSNLPAAVEVAASNLLPGGTAHVSLAPSQAFGEYDESLVRRVPASALSQATALSKGERIVFKTPMGDIDAKIVELDGDEAVIDLNHEYAGRSATFDIELVALVHESAIHRELHPAGCACGCDKLKAQIG